jgi:putative membrane-bound dehydrogenase-like protein
MTIHPALDRPLFRLTKSVENLMSPRFHSRIVRILFMFVVICTGAAEPPVYDSERSEEQPVSGTEAVRKIEVPEGFKAALFASEPMVRNPIALECDAKGRLWVAENYSYAERGLRLDPNLKDRLVIFDDRDGDGTANSKEVFTDRLHNLTGFAIGRGGVWAICPPQLLFIPDRNADDSPDGPPVSMLDGFVVPLENHHNFANGLKFGPDGWLYGRAGGSSPSLIGRPGTPAENRIPLHGGIWRFHPASHRFEVLAHGTTNPWGLDWDEHGEAFFTNTVNGHLWHLIAGSHLDRLHTIDPNPFVYELMQQTADHFHYDTGKGWIGSRDGAANHLGGGHAHQGALIYQGNRWPERYRGRLFTINFHGRRINADKLELTATGYVGRHEKDLAIFGDTWFRGIDMAHTPGGDVVVIDWSDTGECHENTGVHRSSGRIYVLSSGDAASSVANFDSNTFLDDLKSDNVFLFRRALSAVRNAPSDYREFETGLRTRLTSKGSARNRLRALWALLALDTMSKADLIALTKDADPHLRTWAVRALLDGQSLDTILGQRSSDTNVDDPAIVDRLAAMAASETSSLVRLQLASSLQRLETASARAIVAEGLIANPADHDFDNLVKLVWYGIAPIADSSPETLADLAHKARWPKLVRMISRRLTSEMTVDRSTPAVDVLISSPESLSVEAKAAIIDGLAEGLAGRDQVAEPAEWKAFAASVGNAEARNLSAIFGDGLALDAIRKIALDESQDMKTRASALKTLIRRKPDDLMNVCSTLLGVRYLNVEALAGIATTSDPAAAEALIRTYRNFALQDRPRVIDTLASRPAWAMALLNAVKDGRIPSEEISVLQARQIRSLDDPALSNALEQYWGKLATTSEAKQAALISIKAELESNSAATRSIRHGRTVYERTCGQCHTLYGDGGKLGPDITGSQRQNFDYLMENVLDPSAVVSPDFRVTQIEMKDGRVLSGLVRPRDNSTLALVTPTETAILLKSDIAEQKSTPQSIMPEGQLESLSKEDRVALLHYLMTAEPPIEEASKP